MDPRLAKLSEAEASAAMVRAHEAGDTEAASMFAQVVKAKRSGAASPATTTTQDAAKPSESPPGGILDALQVGLTHRLPAAIAGGAAEYLPAEIGSGLKSYSDRTNREADALYQRPAGVAPSVAQGMSQGVGPTLEAAGYGIAEGLGGSAPGVAASMAKLNPLVRLGSAAVTGAQATDEIMKERRKTDPNAQMTWGDRANVAAQMAIDAVPFGLGHAAKGLFGKQAIDAASEGAQEMAQEGLTIGGAAAQGGSYTPGEVGERLLEAGVVGSASAPIVKGSVAGAQAALSAPGAALTEIQARKLAKQDPSTLESDLRVQRAYAAEKKSIKAGTGAIDADTEADIKALLNVSEITPELRAQVQSDADLNSDMQTFRNLWKRQKEAYTDLVDNLYESGQLSKDEREALVAREDSVLKMAGKHTQSLTARDIAKVEALQDVDQDTKSLLVESARDLNTIVNNAKLKLNTGPMERIVGSAVGAGGLPGRIIGGAALGSLGGMGGAVAGAILGPVAAGGMKSLARGADKMMGSHSAPVLQRARARERAAQMKGLDGRPTLGRLQEAADTNRPDPSKVFVLPAAYLRQREERKARDVRDAADKRARQAAKDAEAAAERFANRQAKSAEFQTKMLAAQMKEALKVPGKEAKADATAAAKANREAAKEVKRIDKEMAADAKRDTPKPVPEPKPAKPGPMFSAMQLKAALADGKSTIQEASRSEAETSKAKADLDKAAARNEAYLLPLKLRSALSSGKSTMAAQAGLEAIEQQNGRYLDDVSLRTAMKTGRAETKAQRKSNRRAAEVAELVRRAEAQRTAAEKLAQREKARAEEKSRKDAERAQKASLAQEKASSKAPKKAEDELRDVANELGAPRLGGWVYSLMSEGSTRAGVQIEEQDVRAAMDELVKRKLVTQEDADAAFSVVGARVSKGAYYQIQDIAALKASQRLGKTAGGNQTGRSLTRDPLMLAATLQNAKRAVELAQKAAPIPELAQAASRIEALKTKSARRAMVDRILEQHPRHAEYVIDMLAPIAEIGGQAK
jgi:hypothetical protein